MKRITTALLGGAAVATVAFASASVLPVNGGIIQAGVDSNLSCDSDGVKANWGLETDDNSVRSVRIEGISSACIGADMFIKVNDLATKKVTITGDEASISFTPYLVPQDVHTLKVWIEG